MPRGPARPYPSYDLRAALAIPQGILENNAGRPMNRILLAESLGHSPAGTTFRDLVAAANKYGLITGNYSSETVTLTPLGERVVRPQSEEERLDGLRQAMAKIPLFAKLLDHYNNNRLPVPALLKSALEKPPFNVNPVWSEEAAQVFIETGRLTGLIRDVSGAMWVLREAGAPVEAEPNGTVPSSTATDEVAASVAAIEPPNQESPGAPGPTPQTPTPPAARQFFVAHGRDRTALSQLQSILKELDIPYMVDEEEPHAGRPISQKVADMMRSCSAGIFIFSGDDEVVDADGGVVKRPRMNVVFELGAASLQYGQRVVIFKEKGVEFPTDFRDLGYIEYEKGQLSAKSMELLRELIRLKAVRVLPGT